MNGLSDLATMISVLSFPLMFVVLLYPHLAPSQNRWHGVLLYGGLSVGMMLVAVWSLPTPQDATHQEWSWVDWLVFVSGSGSLLAFVVRKYSIVKKEARARKDAASNKRKKGVHADSRREKKKPKI